MRQMREEHEKKQDAGRTRKYDKPDKDGIEEKTRAERARTLRWLLTGKLLLPARFVIKRNIYFDLFQQ